MKFRPECSLNREPLHYSNESFTSNDVQEPDYAGNEIAVEECDKFREVLAHRCVGNVDNYSRPDTVTRKDSQGSIEKELAMLNREMENIQIECQEIVETHKREHNKVQKEAFKMDPHRSPRIVPRMGTRLEFVKHGIVQSYETTDSLLRKEGGGGTPSQSPKMGQQSVKSSDKDKDKEREKDASTTTSAYNTGGESCRSTPLTLELNQASSSDGEKGFKNSMLCLATPTPTATSTSLSPSSVTTPTLSNNLSALSVSDTEKQTQTPAHSQNCSSDEQVLAGKVPLLAGTVPLLAGTIPLLAGTVPLGDLKGKASMGESLQDLYIQYADVMYTNQANLQHTIAIQQKLFQQQMDEKSRAHGNQPRTGNSGTGSDTTQKLGEYQVPPGEYEVPPSATPPDSGQMEWVVKRRPDGTRYITRRPIRNKLLKERAKKIAEERCGMTTDDDAMSELKTGRYWNKEDRKRHIEKARDQKKRREMMMKAKMETLKETEEKKEMNIVDLSHRKMNRHKTKKVYDDFVTVQEMLAHGSRGTDGSTTYNPLLSVTTV